MQPFEGTWPLNDVFDIDSFIMVKRILVKVLPLVFVFDNLNLFYIYKTY